MTVWRALGGAVAVLALAAWSSRPASLSMVQQPPPSDGVVRVAYPEEPVRWYPGLGADDEVPLELPAVVDLAALWGLPLYRIDEWGQLRPGLAESAEVIPGDPWTVEIRLRPGTWSDGRPVVAADVVATVQALRGRAGTGLDPVVAVAAADERTVRIAFDRPYGRWPYLLSGGWSVLPAHVIADGGIDRFATGVPVSGGPFSLARYEAGLRAIFRAHPGSPLGAPALDRVEVYFTPDYETALGLLAERRVDVALGYLALNPVERALELGGVAAAAPLGGTWVSVRWREVDRDVRAAARESIDVAQLIDGLLDDAGAPMTSLIPGTEGPWEPTGGAGSTRALAGRTLTVLVPGEQEALGFTARVLQRELRTDDASVELARIDVDELSRSADGAILVRRDTPRPSLSGRYGDELTGAAGDLVREGDRVGSPSAGSLAVAMDALRDAAVELPLYRIGVAHAWHEALSGMRPSSWPGVGFWSVGEWHWPDGPPEQAPALRRARS